MEMKNALVTGASHGIGKAIAIALGKNGYRVGINYRGNEQGAKDTCQEIINAGGEAIIIQADVAKYDDLVTMFEKYSEFAPSIDLMVNNAGVTVLEDFLEFTEELWDRVTNIDWKGTYFGTQLAAKNMVANKKPGVIINIASNHVAGCFPRATAYAATKSAVVKFTENAAMELAPYGIRVLSIAPGYTDVWSDGKPNHPLDKKKGLIPLGRFAEPYEIADVLLFLASDKCSYMTGSKIVVDGGALLPVLPANMVVDGKLPNYQV